MATHQQVLHVVNFEVNLVIVDPNTVLAFVRAALLVYLYMRLSHQRCAVDDAAQLLGGIPASPWECQGHHGTVRSSEL